MANTVEQCEVLVVGGGPAGSSCAGQLRKAGLDVMVLDKATFPRDKVCAGWITPQIAQTLQLELTEYAHQHTFQPITGFRTGMIDGPTLLTHFEKPVSYAIRRCEFDHYLLQRAGVRTIQGESIRSIRKDNSSWIINDRIRARMLVGAGGHFCPVSQQLNPKTAKETAVILAQESEFALTDKQLKNCPIEPEVPELYFCQDLQGYGWCVRKQNYLNVGLGREDKNRLSEHIDHFVKFLRATGRIDFEITQPFRGHAYRLQNSCRPRLVDDGIMLIGDAAGLADSHSGEGIRPAIESGLLAAQTIHQAASHYRSAYLQPFVDLLKNRFTISSKKYSPPSVLHRWIGKQLMKTRWFTSHILLKKWFLHADEPALMLQPS
jgi:geranylgeranyl reductase family protein